MFMKKRNPPAKKAAFDVGHFGRTPWIMRVSNITSKK